MSTVALSNAHAAAAYSIIHIAAIIADGPICSDCCLGLLVNGTRGKLANRREALKSLVFARSRRQESKWRQQDSKYHRQALWTAMVSEIFVMIYQIPFNNFCTFWYHPVRQLENSGNRASENFVKYEIQFKTLINQSDFRAFRQQNLDTTSARSELLERVGRGSENFAELWVGLPHTPSPQGWRKIVVLKTGKRQCKWFFKETLYKKLRIES